MGKDWGEVNLFSFFYGEGGGGAIEKMHAQQSDNKIGKDPYEDINKSMSIHVPAYNH